MSERLSDTYVAEWARYQHRGTTLLHDRHELAQEVQASRKLIADLLALHERQLGGGAGPYCLECECGWPCPTVRLIDEARK